MGCGVGVLVGRRVTAGAIVAVGVGGAVAVSVGGGTVGGNGVDVADRGVVASTVVSATGVFAVTTGTVPVKVPATVTGAAVSLLTAVLVGGGDEAGVTPGATGVLTDEAAAIHD